MKIFRKIIAAPLFVIAGIALANLVISIPQLESFEDFLIAFLIYGITSSLFTLGAILWDRSIWKIFIRNFLFVGGCFSL